MSSPTGGGGQQGPNLHALGLLDAKAPGKTDQPAKSFDELIEQIFNLMAKAVGRFVAVKTELPDGGITAGMDLKMAGIRVDNNVLHQAIIQDLKGGGVADVLLNQVGGGRLDFSKVSGPPIEAAAGGQSFASAPASEASLFREMPPGPAGLPNLVEQGRGMSIGSVS